MQWSVQAFVCILQKKLFKLSKIFYFEHLVLVLRRVLKNEMLLHAKTENVQCVYWFISENFIYRNYFYFLENKTISDIPRIRHTLYVSVGLEHLREATHFSSSTPADPQMKTEPAELFQHIAEIQFPHRPIVSTKETKGTIVETKNSLLARRN